MHIGVDEAGKGPVLGSMYAAAVRAPMAALPPEIRDSKALSADRRESFARRLRADDRVRIGVAAITADDIDDPATDMNGLTVTAHAEAAGAVAEAADRVYLDAADVDADRFGRRVAEILEVDVGLEAAHRADESTPHVAAASVIAKVERDAHVAELAAEYGDVGSGYPSDPATRTFLEDHVEETGGLPACARSSWATARRILADAHQSKLGEY